jgi:hypothetical protein
MQGKNKHGIFEFLERNWPMFTLRALWNVDMESRARSCCSSAYLNHITTLQVPVFRIRIDFMRIWIQLFR